MCKKGIPDLVPACPRCRTDLSLLVDHVSRLEHGLAQADALTRQGELGEAVWAYLDVLEVDPDHPTARQQVSRVVTAVRQFDRGRPERRWLQRWRRQARFRQWLAAWESRPPIPMWVAAIGVVLLLAVAFGSGYLVGRGTQLATAAPTDAIREGTESP
jgi:hypothetical protein